MMASEIGLKLTSSWILRWQILVDDMNMKTREG
jgi:hypothetical protein